MPRKQTAEDIEKLHAREKSAKQDKETALGVASTGYGEPKINEARGPVQQLTEDQTRYTEYHDNGTANEGAPDPTHRDRRRE